MRVMQMIRQTLRWGRLLALVVALLTNFTLPTTRAYGHDPIHHGSQVLELVGFDQRLDHQIPLDTRFRDEMGKERMLSAYLGNRPVALVLSYFECETLCPLVRAGLIESLRELHFTVGSEFDVLLVSIDPDETPAHAATAKAETLDQYGRAGSEAGWHFLTGEHDAIDRLAESIGFRYAYDGELDEYAHPSGIVLLTPQGRIARYFFGIDFAAQDLRLGLVDASENRIGSPIDQLLLLCYHYDPNVGRYTPIIMNVVRLAGMVSVGVIGALILLLRRQETGRTQTLG